MGHCIARQSIKGCSEYRIFASKVVIAGAKAAKKAREARMAKTKRENHRDPRANRPPRAAPRLKPETSTRLIELTLLAWLALLRVTYQLIRRVIPYRVIASS